MKETLLQTEAALNERKAVEEELNHSKGVLARRLEKAEASNSELATRIKEEAMAALASRELVGKLEVQLRENESEAVQREQAKVVELQSAIADWKRKSAESERERSELNGELAISSEARRKLEEEVSSLKARIVEIESETLSTRTLLTETERKRGELSTNLAEVTSELETQQKAATGLQRELDDTIARFKASEMELLSQHGKEIDSLVAELRDERSQKEGLAIELTNTKAGMSETIRSVREESAAAQAKLIAENHAKLSTIEDELSEVIRSREIVEQMRNELEDELNQRDEQIEKLSERLEDLELAQQDETSARLLVLSDLETTREGFSKVLHANWGHLGDARRSLEAERLRREELEAALNHAQAENIKLIETLTLQEEKLKAELRDWETRFNDLREEKLSIASEDANLKKIREDILEATAKKRDIEAELTSISKGMKDFQSRSRELQTQKEALLKEREELKAGLNVARSEFDQVQKRCLESKEQESKLADTILSAERRIQSLKKLEMEQAVERKRQQNLLSRGDIFSEQIEALPMRGDFPQEDFYRKLIVKLDLIDDLTKRYDNKWRYPRVAEQLVILKRSFVDFLNDHSVKQFDLQPGTLLSVAERKRIKLVPLQNGAAKRADNGVNGSGNQNAHVVETLRPGYVYQNGSKDVIIRKAEVLVS